MTWRKLNFLQGSRRHADEQETQEELASLKELAEPGELGNLTLAAENARAEWGWTWLERLVQDLRCAARSLKSTLGFTLVAVLTLALAIGANTTIFTAVNAAYLTKLPVRNPDELWKLSWTSRQRAFGGRFLLQPVWDANVLNQGGTMSWFSYAAYKNIRDRNTSFTDVTCSRGGGPGRLVSGNFFRTFGVSAMLGRTIEPEDDRPDSPPVTVISYGYWRSEFGGDPAALGKTVTRDQTGRPLPIDFTIVGVLPKEFFGIDPAYAGSRLIVAMQPALRDNPAALSDDHDWNACEAVIGRLRPGVSPEQARAESEALTAQTILANPPAEAYELPHLKLTPFNRGQDTLRVAVYRPALILGLAVAALLLIACANIAGLLLARGSARRKEIATRLALGAGRPRIIRQLLTESLLLSVLGALPGIAIAAVVSPQLPRLLTRRYTLPDYGIKIEPDLTVALFSAGLAMLAALLFGLAPALNATRLDLLTMMKSSLAPKTRVRFAAGRAMLAVQVGLSIVLLMGGGLFVHTLFNLRAVPMGYDPRNLLFFQVDLRTMTAEMVNGTIGRLRGIPGASSVTASMWPLFTSAPDTYMQVCVPGDRPKDFDDRFADSDVVLPEFFRTWGVPLLRGRDFTLADGPERVVVNQAFVKRYLTGDPVGQAVHLGPDCVKGTIIGVVGNSTDRPRITPRPFVYRRWSQPPPTVTFAVRTPVAAAVAPAMRAIMKGLNAFVVEDVTTGEQYRNDTMSQERLYASLLSGFGAVALFIACLGIYGALAYLVARRTSEIGIRMALGARQSEVMKLVVREFLIPVALGLATGLAAAYPLTRIIASMLFGISRSDPWTIAAAAFAMFLAAAAAAFFPARRASRIDPMRTLRYE